MEPLISGLSTIFPWLIDYTIDISILICLIFIIRSFASKKLPAWWQYSLWIVLLLRMLIPFKFETPLNIPNVVPISINVSLFDSVLIEEELITPEFTPEFSSVSQGWNVHVDDLLLCIWFACSIIFGIYILVKNIRFRNAIRKEPLVTEKRVLDLLEECKKRMNTHTPLKITITKKVKSPALFGYIWPRLLLPVGVPEKLNDDELTYMFMHELGHLKRHDIGVSWLITFIQIFQWFNPFVWLAFYQMRLDQESACDASVLSRIKHNQTIDYASTIVGFLENFCRNHKLPALVGILENQAQIKKRITMIVNYRKNSKIMMFFSTTLLLIIGVIFFSLAGFAKANHERHGMEPAILQTLPYEVQKDLVTQGNDAVHEKEALRFNGSNQKATVATRERVDRDEVIEPEKPETETQNTMVAQDNRGIHEKEALRFNGSNQKATVATQERAVKEEVEPVKPKPESKKILAEVKETKIEGKAEPATFAEVTKKDSAESQLGIEKNRIEQEKQNLQTQKVPGKIQDKSMEAESLTDGTQMAYESYARYSETGDILKNFPSAAYESEQVAGATTFSEKIGNTDEDKSMQYLDLARSVYYISKNLDYTGETSAPSENKSNDRPMQNRREIDEQPKIVSYCPPIYPFRARAKGIEGRVLLRFIVDKKGAVLDPQVVSAEPEGVFEEAALDTVVKYKLKPAKKDGKSVSSVVRLAISFSINDNYLKFAQR